MRTSLQARLVVLLQEAFLVLEALLWLKAYQLYSQSRERD
jgi:hypothetical protein